ncbi:alpha/beta fold hydrolase [Sphaerimonospora cavernae]|uniref:Alpha/beta fold hydrolase n=1 Tax=Sphaerimonospora cavernae TaxID=1740611 RepID=A0ABV6U0X9_9ACTN
MTDVSGVRTSRLDSVTSADDTVIGYRTVGHPGTGARQPGVVVLHGAMESSHSHLQLAEALAADFTVYLPDRRGRGMSGPCGADHGMDRELEDLDAVLTATGARDLIGVSSGALITLRAALDNPSVRRAVVFEPPLSVNGSAPTDWLPRYEAEMARGDIAAALVTGMLGARMGPPVFDRVPRPLLKLLTKLTMGSDDLPDGTGEPSMRTLAPTLRCDLRLVSEAAETVGGFAAIRAEVLLLGGDRSPAYLKTALNALERVLPRVERVELPGLGHGATGNRNRGGRPELVAQVLRAFLKP